MRKSGLICLAFFLLLAVWAPCAQAAEETDVPEFIVESVSAEPGSTIDIPVSIKNNPGILGAVFTLSYEEGLTLKNVASPDDDAFGALNMTKPGKFVSPCNFVWDGQELQDKDIRDGTILVLTFHISEDAVPGKDLGIHISYVPDQGNIVGKDLQKVNPKMTDGAVRVLDEASEPVSITQANIEAGTGTFQIFNPGDRLDGYAIVSEYLENGKIAETQLKQISIDTGTNSIQFEGIDSSKQYKFFMLNAELTPLCKSLELSQNHTEGGKLIE